MAHQRGHTLIELIITLSILGFALAVTAGLGYSVTEGNEMCIRDRSTDMHAYPYQGTERRTGEFILRALGLIEN